MSHCEKLKALKMGLASDFYTALYARSIGGAKEYERYISGIPPLILSDSVGKPLVSWSITGNTVQDGEPTPESPIEVKGVGERTENLFDKTKVRIGWYSSSTKQIILNSIDGSFVSVKVKPDTTYTFSKKFFNISSERNTIILSSEYPEDARTDYNTILNRSYSTETWSFTTGSDDNYANIMFARSATDEEIEKIVNTIMLNEGSELLPYEPYGYKVPVVTRGKNLFDKNSKDTNNGYEQSRYIRNDGSSGESSSHNISEYIYVGNANSFTYSGQVLQTNVRCAFYDSTKKLISTFIQYTNTIPLPTGTAYIRFTIVKATVDTLQLELGSTATEYEPYIEPKTSTIYLNSPLMADEVLKSDGSRKVERGVKVLTGNEPLSKNSSDSNSYLFFMQKSVIGNVKNKKGYCSHLPNSNSYITSVGFGIENAYNVIYFNFGSDIMNAQPSGNTVNGLKEYLKSEYEKGTPVTVWYQLATPTTETVDVPQIPTISGNCSIDVDTEVQPTNMESIYKSSRR